MDKVWSCKKYVMRLRRSSYMHQFWFSVCMWVWYRKLLFVRTQTVAFNVTEHRVNGKMFPFVSE